MRRLAALALVALPALALAAPRDGRLAVPPDVGLAPCPPGAPEPWFHAPPMERAGGTPWEMLPRGLAQPVADARRAAAIARLEHTAFVPLPLAEASELAEGLPSPAEALARYVADRGARAKQADAAVAAATPPSDALLEEQRVAHAGLVEARAWKPGVFRPYLIRCLVFGSETDEVWFARHGTALRTAHGIMTHGCPVAGRLPFVILLPFAPSEVYVTVSAAA
jgi:hypothetical protein